MNTESSVNFDSQSVAVLLCYADDEPEFIGEELTEPEGGSPHLPVDS